MEPELIYLMGYLEDGVYPLQVGDHVSIDMDETVAWNYVLSR